MVKELDLRPRSKEPLPCPFCSGEPIIDAREPVGWDGCAWVHIRCSRCSVAPHVGGHSSMSYEVKEGWDNKVVNYQTAEQAKTKAMEHAIYSWNTRPHNWGIVGPAKMPAFGSRWINKKSGKEYLVVGSIMNANNHAGYYPMVKYVEVGDLDAPECARNVPEFCLKFEEKK